MRVRRSTALVFLAACTALAAIAAAQIPDPAKLARSVTIQRDRYGVPHLFGPTDASVAFGMMYAQAEDNFWQIEDDYIRKLGRSAEIRGPQGLMGDLMVRLFESTRKAQEE